MLAPAIGYARDGFPVSLHFAAVCEASRGLLATDPGCTRDLSRRAEGSRVTASSFRQPALAETLAAIASGGARAFYQGAFAQALDADMRARGGFLRAEDLAAYEPQWKEPLRVRYRGFDVYEQPLVSQGVIVLEAAKLLEGFDLAGYGDRSADFVHLHTEAVKLAVADRQRHLGDPAFVDAPVERLLADEFIAERRRAIDPRRANPAPVGAVLLETAADTSYGCTIDAQGNGVSFIQSIYEVWGSAYLVPGTGTLCNNRMTGFSLDPAHPNALTPGKRTMHTLNTVVVCKDGKLRWLFGTPGAPAQVQSNTQLLTRVVDFGLNPQAAIEAPRMFWPQGTELMVEAPFGAATFAELERRGHHVVDLGRAPLDRRRDGDDSRERARRVRSRRRSAPRRLCGCVLSGSRDECFSPPAPARCSHRRSRTRRRRRARSATASPRRARATGSRSSATGWGSSRPTA